MSKTGKPSLNRRQFLEAGAMSPLYVGSINMLLANLVQGMISRSMALAAGVNPRTYIGIQNPGGPSRWMWDLPLTPYSSSGYVANRTVGTRYVTSGGRYTDVEYATTNIKGVNLPPLWLAQVPKSSGGMRGMQELLDYFLCIRGLNTLSDSHDLSMERHYLPIGADVSVPTLSANYSSKPFDALHVDSYTYIFKSLPGKTFVKLDINSNPILKLMDAFSSSSASGFKSNKELLKTQIDGAAAALDAYARSQHPGAEELIGARLKAKELMSDLALDFTREWNTRYAKYRDLVQRSLDQNNPIVGINDKPIGVDVSQRDARYFMKGFDKKITNADIRSAITANSEPGGMAAHFAVADFVVSQGLSDSILISPKGWGNLSVTTNNGNESFFQLDDEHLTGSVPSLFFNSMYYRCLSSCMLELIDVLKAKGIFANTVIDVHGEFGRNPKDDGSSNFYTNQCFSDHGGAATSVALYSGAISGPMVLGNVRNNAPVSDRRGSWGYQAGIDTFSGQVLDMGHFANTLATMLRVPKPITGRSMSLVYEDNGVFKAVVEKGKQV